MGSWPNLLAHQMMVSVVLYLLYRVPIIQALYLLCRGSYEYIIQGSAEKFISWSRYSHGMWPIRFIFQHNPPGGLQSSSIVPMPYLGPSDQKSPQQQIWSHQMNSSANEIFIQATYNEILSVHSKQGYNLMRVKLVSVDPLRPVGQRPTTYNAMLLGKSDPDCV